ncbi:MAG TPA: alpha-glucan family phosphorylase [Pseudomonadales bacterium]|nr:alpha-glucan family phosphorylase [Pseudomonadales bacterium]
MPHHEFTRRPRTAYFSMEIALGQGMQTYSGGLGILAGDTLRSAADLSVPMVGVTLVSRHGYFRQQLDAKGWQSESDDGWEPERFASRLDSKVALTIAGRQVWISGWLHVLGGCIDGRLPVILLDTRLDENHPDDRAITDHLYGGDETYRLKQEMVLGFGGVRMLRALGFEIRQHHMNEGHSAFLALELMLRDAYLPEELRPGEPRYDLPKVRDLCIFTTHTPVEAGHDKFDYGLVEATMGSLVDLPTLRQLAGEQQLNMTRLALNLSEYVNGVAKRHAEVSRQNFPGYRIHAVTNGVHPATWTAPSFQRLYDHHLPGWCHEPELLSRADQITDAEIWAAHEEAKVALIARIVQLTGVRFHPKLPIIGFARRMTAYKRPALLFSDLARLRAIAGSYPLQIVLAGKAHPHDQEGKGLIQALHGWIKALEDEIPIAFLPNYDMELGQLLTSGSDLWLNTPLRPLEASGTSGMKAAFNGVPQLSVLDGWWIEGCVEGVTGWRIGDSAEQPANGFDSEALYQKLEEVVLPLYYGYEGEQSAWIAVMKGAISKNAAYFNSHRMMRRYASEAYVL